MNSIRKWFDSYVDTFYISCGELHQLKLKEKHSKRVSANTGLIADSLGWSESDRNLAVSAGLLHDVGRFPQYKEYNTFYDFKSVDHGERGLEVMQEKFPTELTSSEERLIIENCVEFHNKKEIPSTIPLKALPFLRIVRDSDKIDIFKVVRDHFERGDTRSIYPGLLPEGNFSDKVLKELSLDGKARYDNIKTLSDVLIFELCWVHDMEYDPSISLLWDRGDLEWLLERLPRTPVSVEIIQKALSRVNEAKRICAPSEHKMTLSRR